MSVAEWMIHMVFITEGFFEVATVQLLQFGIYGNHINFRPTHFSSYTQNYLYRFTVQYLSDFSLFYASQQFNLLMLYSKEKYLFWTDIRRPFVLQSEHICIFVYFPRDSSMLLWYSTSKRFVTSKRVSHIRTTSHGGESTSWLRPEVQDMIWANLKKNNSLSNLISN